MTAFMALAALIMLIALSAPAPVSADTGSVFGRNLVVNGDAEADTGAPNNTSIVKPNGWQTTGAFTVVQYGASGGFPDSTSPGPPQRGKNFFAGGPDNPRSSASQDIDVSAGSGLIDTGVVKYRLAGYLGGFASQGDSTVVTAEFLDASAARIGLARIGPVTPAQRNSITGLFERVRTGALPKGTRTIRLTILAVRTDGAYNDGYADDLEFSLSTT